MKFSEKWGNSIDQAVDLALADLGLTREQVTVTVLEEPSKGFFGIGSKLAKVRVEEIMPVKPVKVVEPVKAEKKEEPKPEKQVTKEDGKEIVIEKCGVEETPRSEKTEKKSRRSGNRKNRSRKPAADNSAEIQRAHEDVKALAERPADLVVQENHPAKTFLEDVVREMGLKVNIAVSANEDTVYIDIDGEDSGTIIGKRGATLDAVQYLASLVVNKDKSNYVRVVIDAEGYREKREKTLEKLAFRMADKAVNSRRNVKMEPMNPYERKVIHTALQSRKEVTTRSEGEEPYRKVIIEPVKR